MSGYAFTTIESGDPYIPQGHSLQRRKFAHIAFDAAQGRAARNNTDSKVLRKAVTVPRTARTRIRKSARADNHSVSEVFILIAIYQKKRTPAIFVQILPLRYIGIGLPHRYNIATGIL